MGTVERVVTLLLTLAFAVAMGLVTAWVLVRGLTIGGWLG